MIGSTRAEAIDVADALQFKAAEPSGRRKPGTGVSVKPMSTARLAASVLSSSVSAVVPPVADTEIAPPRPEGIATTALGPSPASRARSDDVETTLNWSPGAPPALMVTAAVFYTVVRRPQHGGGLASLLPLIVSECIPSGENAIDPGERDVTELLFTVTDRGAVSAESSISQVGRAEAEALGRPPRPGSSETFLEEPTFTVVTPETVSRVAGDAPTTPRYRLCSPAG